MRLVLKPFPSAAVSRMLPATKVMLHRLAQEFAKSLVGPGTGSELANITSREAWQLNNSGNTTNWAPCLAASSTQWAA